MRGWCIDFIHSIYDLSGVHKHTCTAVRPKKRQMSTNIEKALDVSVNLNLRQVADEKISQALLNGDWDAVDAATEVQLM